MQDDRKTRDRLSGDRAEDRAADASQQAGAAPQRKRAEAEAKPAASLDDPKGEAKVDPKPVERDIAGLPGAGASTPAVSAGKAPVAESPTAEPQASEPQASKPLIASRHDEYLIIQAASPLGLPALSPLVALAASNFNVFGNTSNDLTNRLSALANLQLSAMADQLGDDVQILDKIIPTGLSAMANAYAPPVPSVIVARMPDEKAQQLQDSYVGQLVVARNAPLLPADASPFVGAMSVDPSVLRSAGARFTFTIEISGDQGPLANAEVTVFGTFQTTQAVTDDHGRASFALSSETQGSIKGILAQPASDYWNLLIRDPQLIPDGVNAMRVRSLLSTLPGLATSDMFGWGQTLMGLDKIDASFRGQGVKVAIVDSGADNTHPDLRTISRGYDFPQNDQTGWTRDSIGHGSHCAGIICGISNNGTGIRGFAPDAEVHALRILPEGRPDDLIKAIQYCIDKRIDVANFSLGGIGGDPDTVQKLRTLIDPYLAKAKSVGVACIVAAGNSASPVMYPASSPHVLAVSALGKLGEFPPDSYHASLPIARQPDGLFFPRFSCFGPEVGLAAPGVAVVSSVPGGGFVAWDGTSMAAPHVTGLAALVLAHNSDFQTTFSVRNAARVDHLFKILQQTAQPLNLGDPQRTGAGLPTAPAALKPMVTVNGAAGSAFPNTVMPGAAPTGGLTADQIAAITRAVKAALQNAMPH
ncbi:MULTISPECIES: S8 family serine peptidase [Methylobacterium]|uniref:S8 family serine peptidase n=1 Tax=Methylobacterium TaxID=407 RepID=UPI0013EAEB83|nr:S8 family serine peptidase [Methylobacterium sp. DB0501]NGM32381.1 S8 family serine peptidase [Methylobacterium sp. DB0501]